MSIFALLVTLLVPQTAFAFSFDPEFIISDSEFLDERALTKDQVKRHLDRGYLGEYETKNWEGDHMSALDIVWNASQEAGINPKVLLVLLQKEQSLILDDNPTQKQLDWATGYAVCDGCSFNDTGVARFQGFGKQVNSAALQFVEGYFADIGIHGVTQGKYGPGVEIEIDGELITPKNAATASLYAYTPHFHGNELFAVIWDDWFGVSYPTGSLLKDAETGDIYRIEFGMKRHIKSNAALISRYNQDMVIEVPSNILDAYAEGSSVNFPNYSLLIDGDGKIYLLVDETLRHISDWETFRSIGFNIDEAIEVDYDDIVDFDIGRPITLDTLHPTGRLVQIGDGGSLFYLEDGKRHFVADSALVDIALHGLRAEIVGGSEIEQLSEGRPILIPDGYLVKTADSPSVYLISEDVAREITSEEVFRSYGWSFDSVITVNQSLFDFHSIGDSISLEL